MNAIITVVGSDKVGIIAKVSQYLSEHKINIADITQTILSGNFVMINSEINAGNCQNWFKQIKNDRIVNIYTGWTLVNKGDVNNETYYDDSFKTVYTMIYDIFNKIDTNNCIVACHEMPFTVITNDNLLVNDKKL